MMIRNILHLRDASQKSLFASLSCYKTDLNTYNIRQLVRGFKLQNIRVKKFPARNVKVKSVREIDDPHVQRFGRLWKPLGFTILFTGSTVVGTSIWEYESKRKQAYGIYNYYKQHHQTGWMNEVKKLWKKLSEAEKVFIPICIINVLVYLAWSTPRLQPIMTRYFVASAYNSAKCWPMLLAVFSHQSLIHLSVNMFALNSFSQLAVSTLGKEQFVTLYLNSGVIASFVSYVHKILLRIPSVSLGASGAVIGILGFLSTEFPDMRVCLVFLPTFTFTADTGIKALLSIDTIGCLLMWKFLDHAAHLGGAIFGIFWQKWGNAYIWKNRVHLLQQWHKLRNS